MFRKLFLIPLLALFLTLGAEATQAQVPAQPIWQAEYWDNRYLSGPPEEVRPENFIDNNWGTGSPADDIDNDNFSARWTANVYFEPALYTFNAISDDGVRVWVNGDLIIDAWYDHPVETFVARKYLSDGLHHIRVEYYEHNSGAVMRFWWAPAPPTTAQNWQGQYFNNTGLRGEPEVVRQDPEIAFNWDGVNPAPGVDDDTFSVRWTRTLNLPAGSYNFRLTVDDGGRLWVNGRRLIDAWYQQSPRTYKGEVYLPGGPVPVRLEYFNQTGGSFVHLSWSETQLRTETWRGEYYNGLGFSGSPALIRNESALNFNWGQSSPASAQLGVDRFTARWTRTLDPAPGRYQFNMTVDDGGRLWVDDRLLIDAWQVQSPRTYSGQISLDGQPVTVRMEYFENTGGAVAQLNWSQVSEQPQTSVEWRDVVPERYHPLVQRCLRSGRFDLDSANSRADWASLFTQCLEWSDQTTQVDDREARLTGS